MKRTCLPLAAGLVLTALLTACGSTSPGSSPSPSVAVTTVKAVQQSFHAGVSAWGSIIADSNRLERLNLAHGGQISALPVTQGQAVRKGQVLLRMVTDPAALQAYKSAANALSLARSQYAHTRQLAAQKLATRSQLDAARQALADAEAALQAQRALGTGKRVQVLRAPADGVVTALHVGRGQRVAAQAPLLDFAPTAGRVAVLGVQPQRAPSLRAGMDVNVQAVYDNTAKGTGKVLTVGQSIDPNTGLVPVRVQIPAALAARMATGSPVMGTILSRRFQAWAVPRQSVLHDRKGSYLFQERQGHALRVAVDVVQPEGDTLGVEGKLDPRLPVIVLGAYELANGDAVRKAKSS